MKVLLVNGGPHERGCTYTALCEIQKELKASGIESEIFWLGNKSVRGCIGCGGCRNNDGHCVFNDDVANIITSQLLYLNSVDSESPIKMFINSPGGSVVDGLAIYDAMNWVDPKVETYGIGMAASMGSILLSSGAKGRRFAFPHSRVMIHQVSSGMQGQCADLEIAVREAKKHQEELYKILSENTGKSFGQIAIDADRDCWFTAREAVEYGLIDEILIKNK
jgi:ATP-dependent Clp protease protease subunit